MNSVVINPLILFVNGKKVVDQTPDPEQTLLSYLREKLYLCGTKLGCAEGGCGACTVMISKYDRNAKKINHFAVNACLTPICSLHGLAVTTVEGIGSTKTKLHPVQERIAKAHGSQCGFCTPGFVMSMYTLLRNTPIPDMKQLIDNFQGNLCRCTGYRPIIEGYSTFTKEFQSGCAMGKDCCKFKKQAEEDDKLFDISKFIPFDPNQEPIFPPELMVNDDYDNQSLEFQNERNVTWYRPANLTDLVKFKQEFPDAKIVVGNTEVGVEVKFKKMEYKNFISPVLVPELNQLVVSDDGIKVGSAVTLASLEELLKSEVEKRPEHESRIYKAIFEMLQYFGGKQVRNVASVGGNVMTASPISDLNPIFLAIGAEIEVFDENCEIRKVLMDQGFFTRYRKTILKPTDVLISIFIPRSKPNQHFYAFKQSKRREDDISIVTAAFNVEFEDGSPGVINQLAIAFGGMGPTTVLAQKTQELSKRLTWNDQLVELITDSLLSEFKLEADAPGGMVSYRKSLVTSLFYKFYLEIQNQLKDLSENEQSGLTKFKPVEFKSRQTFQRVDAGQDIVEPLRRPIVTISSIKQATGEAMYIDDIPPLANELHGALVLSTRAHAKILSVDESEAMKLPGVHGFFSGKDIPNERNILGVVFKDEHLFEKDIVRSAGLIVGIVVAETRDLAKRAARLVKVEYEDLFPVIVSIEDAIKHKSYYTDYPKFFCDTDVTEAFANADHVVEGTLRMGGQEHFYLEPQIGIAIPRDSDEMEIYASTQSPALVQRDAATVTGYPFNKVICKTKRLGGAFGGKENRNMFTAIAAAFVASKLGRPVRVALDRDEDMMCTGNRHPFYFKYKLAVRKDGLILACDVEMFSNGGNTMDASFYVLERAGHHIMNSYHVDKMRIVGSVMKTNLPSNTSFRGFGGPQGMLCAETMIRHVAQVVGRDYLEIQKMHLFKENQATFYKQVLINCNMTRCFNEIQERSNYSERLAKVKEFNLTNKWKKRGISLVNCMYGIALLFDPHNQAIATINIYLDGSISLVHHGVEMGQGLYTKMIQIASTVLKVPFERFHTNDASTEKTPNSTSTCGSYTSDLIGMAVVNACEETLKRLKPIQEQFPNESWNDWIMRAYNERIPLSATGYYNKPRLVFDDEFNYDYFVFGSTVSEVEIDCLTGDHQVIRTDIIMDIGSSLNPAIDIGQIEGAFMQGYGLFTLEELIYSPDGQLYSKGPGAYKIPAFTDIPGEFNVSLLTGVGNPRAVFSSKGLGEPPLFMAASVFFAIKEAISAARVDEGFDPHFELKSPATCERIRMACKNKFLQFQDEEVSDRTPWNVMP